MTRRGGRKTRQRREHAVEATSPQPPSKLTNFDTTVSPQAGHVGLSPPTTPVGPYREHSADPESPAVKPPRTPRTRRSRSTATAEGPDAALTSEQQQQAPNLNALVDSIEAVAIDITAPGAEDDRVFQIAEPASGLMKDAQTAAPGHEANPAEEPEHPQLSESTESPHDKEPETPSSRRRRRRRRSKRSQQQGDDDGPLPADIDSCEDAGASPQTAPESLIEAAASEASEATAADGGEESVSVASVGNERQLPASERKAARALRKQAAKDQKRNRTSPAGSSGRKPCGKCAKPECEMLIRCASKEWSGWKLVCAKCWTGVSGGMPDGDAAHPDYRYGGLWRYRKLGSASNPDDDKKGKGKSKDNNKSKSKSRSKGQKGENEGAVSSSSLEHTEKTEEDVAILAGMAVLVAIGQEPH